MNNSNRSSSNGLSLSAIAAAQREKASLQRRAPAPTVVVNPVQMGLVSRLMFVDTMRRSLRRIAPQPVVYQETYIINQPPPVVIGGSMTTDPTYYDPWGYPYEGYPQDEYAYYQGYYDQGAYLEDFGYSFDEQGSLYISPQDDYDPLLSGYYTDHGYVAPPAYLVGPGIEMASYYPISRGYYGGYGFRGMMHDMMRNWMTPYNYHQTVYYWNRMGGFMQSKSGLSLTLSLLLPLSVL